MTIEARRRLFHRLLPCMLLLALVAVVIGEFGLDRTTRLAGPVSAESSALMRWHDASHDWLLVGDGATDQLSIYDAVDGRLLRRVSVRHGLRDAHALAQRDGRLFVVGDDGQLGELKLPQLQLVAANTR